MQNELLAFMGLGGIEVLVLFLLLAVIMVIVYIASDKKAQMFSGTESTRFGSTSPKEKVFEEIEHALANIGDIRINKRGEMDILPRFSFENIFTRTNIDGFVKEKEGQYTVTVFYSCTLSELGWTVLAIGILFVLIGLVVLIAPAMKKGYVDHEVRRALQRIE